MAIAQNGRLSSIPVHEQKTIFGHPAGLYVLFFTEMWERFSYYGMRALLILYMTKYLLLEPDRAATVLGYETLRQWIVGNFGELSVQGISSQIYGLYTGFVYFTPFFGGILADQILGQRKTVYLGALLMAIGHFLMASEQFFLIALFFLILGNGAFKPNISSQVGNLYPEGDERRDGAFTIFYMGINLGAFFSPLVCGTLGQMVGWHWGFGAAGVGMIAGLLVYHFGRRYLPDDRITKIHQAEARHEAPKKEPLTRDEWARVFALVFLCAVNIAFWGIFEQQGNTLALWADERTNWSLLGFQIPSSWYQSFNPGFIFLFAPLLSAHWSRQAKKGKATSSVSKMGFGCLISGLAYLIMIAASHVVPEGERGSFMWLGVTTWIFTMGELYLSPIGLSLVSRVAPARMVSMLMGMWFLSSFFGNYAAGYLGSFYERMPKDEFFGMLSAMGVIAGLIFYAANKPLDKILGHHAKH